MTREEAIKLLRKLRETIDRNNVYGEAEEMGIQALEQESIRQKCDNDHDCEHCDWVECPIESEDKEC